MEGILKLGKKTSALVVIKKIIGYAKDEIIATGTKIELAEKQHACGTEQTTKIMQIRATAE